MDKFIPLSVPNLKGNELKYVTDAIETEWVSAGGAYIDRYETEFADYLNVETAVACQSGTAGLHLALILSGVEKDHEVIVPTLTFIASVNPVKYLQAYPIFMDCDDSLCMDMGKLKEFCQAECDFVDNELINKSTGKHIKAVVVVHVFGNMADMPAVMDIAEKYNLKVIEDATEALGTYYLEGRYKGKYAGTIADIGVYSFNGNKIITTGGGGMMDVVAMAVQVVIFTLGQEEYAMPIEVVREIIRLAEVRTLPEAPAYVHGLINLRGKAIPLIDLHVRFGIGDSSASLENQNTFALITEVYGNHVGFAVDQVREVRILENIVPPPPLVTAPFIGGIVNLPDRIIIHLVPEQIMQSNEVQGLSRLTS